jgi:O-antigen ligase
MTPGVADGQRPVKFLIWLVLLPLVLYALLIGGAWRGIYEADLRSISLGIVAVVMGSWAILSWRRRLLPASRLLPALGVAIGVLGVSSIGSAFPRIGAEYVAWAIVLAALYLLLVLILRSDFFRPRIGALCVLLTLSLGILYLGVIAADWVRWWTLVGSFSPPPLRPLSEGLTYGNPSAVMTMQMLLAGPAIAHVGAESRRARLLVAAILIVAIAVVVVSGSRAGWLGLGTSLVLLGVVWLATRRGAASVAGRLRSRIARRQVLAIVVLGILAIGVGAVLLPGVIYRAGSGGEGLRATYFAVALRIFADHVLTGSGPGTWTILRAGYTEPSEPDFYIPHAHNIYLQTAAELGLIGLAAGCFVLLTVALLVRQGLRDPELRRRRFAWAAAASCLYLGAHQLLDFYANMPSMLLGLAIPVAYLDATASGRAVTLTRWAPSRTARRLLTAGAALGLALSVTFLWWSESHARESDRAVDALNAGDTASALGPAIAATTADPGIPAFQVTLALALERAGDWPAGLAAFQKAAGADDLANSWLGVAAAQVQLGDLDRARISLERAMRLGKQQPTVALDAGWLYLSIGDEDAAVSAMAEALWRLPMLAEDPAWSTRPELVALRDRVLDQALEKAPHGTAWSLALVGGRTTLADTLVAGLPLDQRMLASEVVAAWGDGGEATERQLDAYRSLTSRVTQDPLNEDLVVWCVRLAQHLGFYDEALRFREWIVIVSGGASPSAGTVRMTLEDVPSTDPATVGSLASFYGHYTYRRPTPYDLTPPGLPRLVLLIGEPTSD